jgi:hypothetical protein
VARIVLTSSCTSEGERLARVARSDEIHDSTPRLTIEGSDITVDRSGLDETVFHAARERCSSVGFPLHKTDRSDGGVDELESELNSSNPST